MTGRPPPTPDAGGAPPNERTAAVAPGSGSPRVVRSDALFAGGTQIAIQHDHSTYILRQTRSGKLILTK
jgi:hemin uptake protein HemP